MIRYEDDCVGCGLPCIGSSCPHSSKTPHYFCDDCGSEVSGDELYIHPTSDEQLCSTCMLAKLDKAEDLPTDDGPDIFD